MPDAEGQLFNWSFGAVLERPYRFSWKFEELQPLVGHPVEMHFEMFNDPEGFAAEKQLASYHTLEQKQHLGYNPHAAAPTGVLRVIHPDFLIEHLHHFNEAVNISFVNDLFGYILTFLQRRRVIFRALRLQSSQRWGIALSPLAAGELLDSVAFGPELVRPEDAEYSIRQGLAAVQAIPPDERRSIEMLLRRYNDVLNLPYAYERVESFWRMLEALGKTVPVTPAITAEYQRLKPTCNLKRESGNLQHLVAALVRFNVSYADQQVADAFENRNRVMHEYLNPILVHDPKLLGIFQFLQEAVERTIAKLLAIDQGKLQTPGGYSIIENRLF